MKLSKIAAGALVLGALLGGAAQAGVTLWSGAVDANFVQGTESPAVGITFYNSDRSLDWGTNGTSGLDIGNAPSVALITTNIGTGDGITVTHRNQPIGPPSLEKVDLFTSLTLTPIVPPGLGMPALVLSYTIHFVETTNQPGGGICADGTTNGLGLNTSGCADIFVIDFSPLNAPFMYDGDQYFLSVFETTAGLNPLPTAACFAATGSNDPCIGLRTPEETDTTFEFALAITTQPIPEPGTLALFGAALLGVVATYRRRQS